MTDQFIQFLHPSDAKLTLTTGRKFIIQVKPGLEAFRAVGEDPIFNFNRAVMLPEGPRETVTHPIMIHDRASRVDAADPLVGYSAPARDSILTVTRK